MYRMVLATLVLLAACAERGEIVLGNSAPGATIHDIWVANFRATETPAEGQRSPPRPSTMRYEMYSVSVPPQRDVGSITWPDGTPDPTTDFVTVAQDEFETMEAFRKGIKAADTSAPEVVVFVHGYNTNHAEALYLLTQAKHDFEVPVPTVLFSWPSAEVTGGYLYDRDSVLIARDQLERLFVELSRDRKIAIMGHSMGNLLIMETLRQISLKGSLDIQNDIGALFMISPDIDGELFAAQARSLEDFPQPSVILAAEKDVALRVSAWLTGRTDRLGSDVDRTSVGDLPVAVIDVSAFSDGGLNHKVALQSPAAIAILNDLSEEQLPSEARFDDSIQLLPGDSDDR